MASINNPGGNINPTTGINITVQVYDNTHQIITNLNGYSFTWKLSFESINFTQSGNILEILPFSSIQFYPYNLEITCVVGFSGNTSLSQIELPINQRPTGNLEVSPSMGYAITTLFNFTITISDKENNSPYLVQFFYSYYLDDLYPLTTQSYQNYYIGTLPMGKFSIGIPQSALLFIIVQFEDTEGLVNNVMGGVRTMLPQLSNAALNAEILSLNPNNEESI